jgi:hypothetical protein
MLTEWMAYSQIEPFGEEQENRRAALLATLLANANRDPDKRREPFTVEEILSWLRPSAEEQEPAAGGQTWQQQKAMMQALTAKLAAK